MQDLQHVIKCTLNCGECVRTSGCDDVLNVHTETKNALASQCHFQTRRVSTQRKTRSDVGGLEGRLGKARGSRRSGERTHLSAPPWKPASALPGPAHKSRYLRSNMNSLDISNYRRQLQKPGKANVTVTLQFGVLLGPPLPDCPVSVDQHTWTNFDDAP